jgi:hypothetical protein
LPVTVIAAREEVAVWPELSETVTVGVYWPAVQYWLLGFWEVLVLPSPKIHE